MLLSEASARSRLIDLFVSERTSRAHEALLRADTVRKYDGANRASGDRVASHG